jgi:hypothetical protein
MPNHRARRAPHHVRRPPTTGRWAQNRMTTAIHFNPRLQSLLPETHALLLGGPLVIHDAIRSITLHGSRGLGGYPRPDSDIDLALIVDEKRLCGHVEPESLLRDVLKTTLAGWKGRVKLDLAAVYDRDKCGLKCLTVAEYDFHGCARTNDCMGAYKIQRGFNGQVNTRDLDCRKMQPSLVIWEKNT